MLEGGSQSKHSRDDADVDDDERRQQGRIRRDGRVRITRESLQKSREEESSSSPTVITPPAGCANAAQLFVTLASTLNHR